MDWVWLARDKFARISAYQAGGEQAEEPLKEVIPVAEVESIGESGWD